MNSQKISPNQLKVVKGQMDKYIKAGVEIPEEINDNEKHLFHVIIITDKQLNGVTLDVNVKTKVQTFDDRSWLKHKDNLKQIGFGESFILHDPTEKSKSTEKSSGKSERAELIDQAKSLGYKGVMNVKDEVFEKFILEAKKGPKTKVLTQEDLDSNPELIEKGLKVGDEVSIEVES